MTRALPYFVPQVSTLLERLTSVTLRKNWSPSTPCATSRKDPALQPHLLRSSLRCWLLILSFAVHGSTVARALSGPNAPVVQAWRGLGESKQTWLVDAGGVAVFVVQCLRRRFSSGLLVDEGQQER